MKRKKLIINDTVFDVEVADDVVSRARGLMFRNSLKEKQGMLFVHNHLSLDGYWMENVSIPLSIAFIKDGRIVDIQNMEPNNTKLYHSKVPFDSALEVNSGVFSEYNISVGDSVWYLNEEEL